MKSRLRELKEERRRRLAAARADKAAEEWAAARAKANPDTLSAGELANMIEGLTPDGRDRQGRRVSFAERGVAALGDQRRISTPPERISQ